MDKVNASRRRLTAVDAQTYWMSAKIPNDQFLLYGFDGVAADLPRALEEVRRRAAGCPELTLRVDDSPRWGYPAWIRRDVGDDQFVVHRGADLDWDGCLAAVGALVDDQLDARTTPWRLHVYTPVAAVPGASGPGTVAALQIAHALADGMRSSALAALLFGRPTSIPTPPSPSPLRAAALPWRGAVAARAHRRLVRDTAAGVVPPQADSRPTLRTNTRPAGARTIRTLTRRRATLAGPTVTVAVLAAVSGALAAHLRGVGDDPSTLAAEVPMAKTGPRRDNNHFGNVGVRLYPELEVTERQRAIADELAARRRRAAHPAMSAASRASAAVPAPLLRWGVTQFDADARSPTVTGNTVVSSVHRGAADLRFGAAAVTVTASCPGLSPMMGLTHGVHGIGDTVAVSVHAAASAIGDVDAYVRLLDEALG